MSESRKKDHVQFGRCIHELAAADLDMPYQEYMWVEGTKLSDADITKALDIWGLERPNVIIELVGPVYYSLMSSNMLVHPLLLDKTQDMLKALSLSHGLANPSLTTSVLPEPTDQSSVLPKPTDESSPDAASLHLDDVEGNHQLLQMADRLLSKKIVGAFIALLNACEQTNSWITMTYDAAGMTDHYLLEALRQCSYRPVILAIVNRPDYSKQTDALKALQENAVPLSKGERKELKQLPVTQVPVDVPSSLAQLGHAIWQGWPAPFASHFIFSDSQHPYQLNKLGPMGSLYVSGADGCWVTLRRSMLALRPTILFYQTGKISDFYACAATVMQEKKPSTVTELLEKMNEVQPFWFTDVNNTRKLFGIVPEHKIAETAMEVFDCYYDHPDRFDSSIVVLNPWTDDPYTIVNKVTACFLSVDTGDSMEGDGKETNEETIMMAWTLHETLSENCDWLALRINVLQAIAVVLAMMTTTLAVYITYINMSSTQWAQELLNSPYWHAIELVMIAMPAVGGLAAQMLSRFHYALMWGAMFVTRQQIESEIYRCRTRTGSYRPISYSKMIDDEDDADNPKPEVKPAREILAKKVSDLFTNMSSYNLHDNSMVPSPNSQEVMTKLAEDNTSMDVEAGRKYGTFSEDKTSRYSVLDGEEYFKDRFLPTLQLFQEVAPSLAKRLRAYEVLILLCALVSTLLAAMNMTVCIPIPVAIGGGLTTMMVFEALQVRVAAMNASIGELTAFATRWASLAIYEKRTFKEKAALVDVVENAWLCTSIAYVNGSGFTNVAKSDDKAAEDDKAGNTGSKKEGVK